MKSTTNRFAIVLAVVLIGTTACSGGDETTSTEPTDTSAPTASVSLAPVDFSVVPGTHQITVTGAAGIVPATSGRTR